jgi:PAS domain-containing protein
MSNGEDDSIARERLLKEVLTAKYNMVDVFKQAPAFMCVLRGPDHEFELVNERYLQLIGYREVVGLTVRQALPEIEGQGFFELLDSVFQSGETFTGTDMPVFLQRSHNKPMERRFLDLVYTALKDADGVINGILVHGIDQTERKQSEMALAEREEQLRLALDAADVGLWDVDIEKDTLYWPPRVKAMFGISSDKDVSMKDFYDGLHPEDREHTSISFAKATDPNLRTQYVLSTEPSVKKMALYAG